MIAVVVSRADRASEHVGERLLALADWTAHEDEDRPDGDGGGTYHRTTVAGETLELRAFDGLHIRLDDPTAAFSARPDYLVFLSRHSGDTGPLLTCHFTGNFGEGEYGGESRAFAPACPGVQRALVAGFDEHAPTGYDVAIECTHHGPTDVSVPSVFAELGSGDDEWDDPQGAEAVARAVLDLPDRGAIATVGDPDDPRHVVGLGGGHYAPRFERVVRETAWGVGHVASDWQLDELGHPGEHADALAAAFDASDARFALLESERPALERALSERGYRTVTETWVREVGDRPLDLVADLEAALCPVAEGLRFGAVDADRIEAGDGYEYAVVDLPADLLAEAHGVDAERARAAVAARAVAFETRESGTRAVGRAALPGAGGADAYDGVVDALSGLLAEKYDEVERRPDAVVARTAEFDPGKAATLGVPEGPAFGALAEGESVEVNGETVPPEAVRSEREAVFPV